MTSTFFREDLDSYEVALAQWAKFAAKNIEAFVSPNGLEIEEDGSLWLIHQVKHSERPIRCKDGKAVRLLKLGMGKLEESVPH